MNIPAYVTPFVLIADIVIIGAVLIGLRLALARTSFPAGVRGTIMRRASIALAGWFLLALTLSYFGVFLGSADRWPTIQLGILIPIAAGLIILRRSQIAAEIIDAVPQGWLVGVQLYRTLGIIFILLHGAGQLPPQFALPAGWGDIAVGIVAPMVGIVYARGLFGARAAVLGWNILGLADLVIAVTMGVLTSPSPLQVLAIDAPNLLISAFPLAMVPVFAVPLSVLLHVTSMIKLKRSRQELERRQISTGGRSLEARA